MLTQSEKSLIETISKAVMVEMIADYTTGTRIKARVIHHTPIEYIESGEVSFEYGYFLAVQEDEGLEYEISYADVDDSFEFFQYGTLSAETDEEVFLNKIDFTLLKAQKEYLLSLAQNDHIEGIICLLDSIQDYAVESGLKTEQEVF